MPMTVFGKIEIPQRQTFDIIKTEDEKVLLCPSAYLLYEAQSDETCGILLFHARTLKYHFIYLWPSTMQGNVKP